MEIKEITICIPKRFQNIKLTKKMAKFNKENKGRTTGKIHIIDVKYSQEETNNFYKFKIETVLPLDNAAEYVRTITEQIVKSLNVIPIIYNKTEIKTESIMSFTQFKLFDYASFVKENKENKKQMFSYIDFLKDTKKVYIDNKNMRIDSIDGLVEIHPNVEHLEIGDSNVGDVSDISKLKKLKVLMLYNNDKIKSINLTDLTLDNFSLFDLKEFTSLNTVNISAKKVVFDSCPNFKPVLTGIKDIEELDIIKCDTLKDLTFLKDRNIRKIDFRETKIDSLYGIQYSPNTELSFNNMVQTKNSFEYHALFYNSLKEPIKDYWKEIVEYWVNIGTEDQRSILKMTQAEIKDIFIDGIKLPEEEFERLFDKEEQKYIKSVTTIDKYNL